MERFILYTHYKAQVDRLTDDQAGRLFKAIYWFVEDGNIPTVDDPEVQTALWFICKQIEVDCAKYKVCGKGRNK